ncbi:regulator of G-protein signaling 19 isoform X2 [Hydra vulgaris]|uniref:Regulator of G-protein signaling 19 isoform X2 n=1 Tax=Hydra vulgaris TaxID=6087 RepID=A0ABM4D735_HYDVU|nr:regulator of G-protein signaling 19 isoform X2 [Hydra vulgaris]XP_047123837.1 regulator of G-protein signaling 19 isoform X2 [Hydra vulgaris]
MGGEPMGGGRSVISPHPQHKPQEKLPKTSYFCCNRKSLRREAKTWSVNFEGMLHHPIGRKVFQDFLHSQFSDENLRFWIEVDQYKTMTLSERKIKALSLFNNFISNTSPFEVSLNANHKAEIEKGLKEAHEDLFKSAQAYIFNLMYRDCLPRFLRSKTYKRLCR